MKLTFKSIATEICKREESASREVNITDVSRVLRHLFEILGEYPRFERLTVTKAGVHMIDGAGIHFINQQVSKHAKPTGSRKGVGE